MALPLPAGEPMPKLPSRTMAILQHLAVAAVIASCMTFSVGRAPASETKPYRIVDGKVDARTYNGFRRYHAGCNVLPEVPAARLWERAGYPDEALRPDQLTTGERGGS